MDMVTIVNLTDGRFVDVTTDDAKKHVGNGWGYARADAAHVFRGSFENRGDALVRLSKGDAIVECEPSQVKAFIESGFAPVAGQGKPAQKAIEAAAGVDAPKELTAAESAAIRAEAEAKAKAEAEAKAKAEAEAKGGKK